MATWWSTQDDHDEFIAINLHIGMPKPIAMKNLDHSRRKDEYQELNLESQSFVSWAFCIIYRIMWHGKSVAMNMNDSKEQQMKWETLDDMWASSTDALLYNHNSETLSVCLECSMQGFNKVHKYYLFKCITRKINYYFACDGIAHT